MSGHAERIATEVFNDTKRRMQQEFAYRICNEMLSNVQVYPLSPLPEFALPPHDVVMVDGGPAKMREAFAREPDTLASFLPDGFAVVNVEHLKHVMDMLAKAVPVSVTQAFGPMSGADYADAVLRVSADRLLGLGYYARREHEINSSRPPASGQ